MRKFFLLLVAIFLFQSNIFAQLPSYITAGADAWYPFNNNTNDASGKNQNLLSSGVTFATDRFGVANSAASFDGTSNYLNKQNFPNSANNGFVISAWVKPDALSNVYKTIFQLGKYTSSNNTSRVYLTSINDLFATNTYVSGTSYNLNKTGNLANVWTHVAVEWDGASFYLYINGQVVLSTPTPAPNSVVGDLTIGASYVNGVLGEFYKGLIDDVVVYNTILPACKVNEMYRSCVLQPLDNLTKSVGSTATFDAPVACWDTIGITYKWQVNTGIDGFKDVTNAGQFSGATSPSLSIKNLTIGNTDWLFRCVLTYGCGAKTSSEATLTVTQSTGLNDVQEASAFSISPNPAAGEMVLSVSANLVNKPYRIFNSIGQQVIEGKIAGEKTRIDLSSLSNGLYSVQLQGNYSKRLVINK